MTTGKIIITNLVIMVLILGCSLVVMVYKNIKLTKNVIRLEKNYIELLTKARFEYVRRKIAEDSLKEHRGE